MAQMLVALLPCQDEATPIKAGSLQEIASRHTFSGRGAVLASSSLPFSPLLCFSFFAMCLGAPGCNSDWSQGGHSISSAC